MKKKLLIALLVLQTFSISAQNDLIYPEYRFLDYVGVYPKDYLSVKIENLSFIKNNEYFNLIADGYTLFGNKLNAEAIVYPDDHYRISVGATAIKYYGLDTFSEFIPYFSLKINNGASEFYFGKLNTKNNHQLSEQIYSFERHLDGRSIENGVAHRYRGRLVKTDTWLEWEQFIFKGDNQRERLNFGQTTTVTIPIGTLENNKIKIPLQLYLHHRGGQINNRSESTTHLNNAMVVANYSGGIEFSKWINRKFSLGASYQYFAHNINSDNVEELQFKTGHAHLFKLLFDNRKWHSELSYWKAHQFVAPKGDNMYQSISKRVEKYVDNEGNPETVFANYAEPDRSLLQLSVSYQKHLFHRLFLAAKLDGYLQLNKGVINTNRYSSVTENQFDYAIGLYLVYKINQRILTRKD